MRHVERVRQEVVAHTERYLDHLRVRWSMVFGDDPELLDHIGRPRHIANGCTLGQACPDARHWSPDRLTALVLLVSDTVMRALGHTTNGPVEPRFSRTKRLVTKRTKPPRGLKVKLTKREASEESADA